MSTKIAAAASAAFAAGKTFHNRTWGVTSGWNEAIWLSLHGNTVARRRNLEFNSKFGPDSNGISAGEVQIWTQGYATPTTMRAINAALSAMDMPWRACLVKRVSTIRNIITGEQRPLIEGMKITKEAALNQA